MRRGTSRTWEMSCTAGAYIVRSLSPICMPTSILQRTVRFAAHCKLAMRYYPDQHRCEVRPRSADVADFIRRYRLHGSVSSERWIVRIPPSTLPEPPRSAPRTTACRQDCQTGSRWVRAASGGPVYLRAGQLRVILCYGDRVDESIWCRSIEAIPASARARPHISSVSFAELTGVLPISLRGKHSPARSSIPGRTSSDLACAIAVERQ